MLLLYRISIRLHRVFLHDWPEDVDITDADLESLYGDITLASDKVHTSECHVGNLYCAAYIDIV